jgi:hypothetical protein
VQQQVCKARRAFAIPITPAPILQSRNAQRCGFFFANPLLIRH